MAELPLQSLAPALRLRSPGLSHGGKAHRPRHLIGTCYGRGLRNVARNPATPSSWTPLFPQAPLAVTPVPPVGPLAQASRGPQTGHGQEGTDTLHLEAVGTLGPLTPDPSPLPTEEGTRLHLAKQLRGSLSFQGGDDARSGESHGVGQSSAVTDAPAR